MSKFQLKIAHLKNQKLINLRNVLRSVLYRKVYSGILDIYSIDKKIFNYMSSLKIRLDSKESDDITHIKDSFVPNLALDGKYILLNAQRFLEELEGSNLTKKEKYIRCSLRHFELIRYTEGLEKLINRSIVKCPDCSDFSHDDMFRLPFLGVTDIIASVKYMGAYWEGMWVCKEHLKNSIAQ